MDLVLRLSSNSSLFSYILLFLFIYSCINPTDIYWVATVYHALCQLLNITIDSFHFYFSSFSQIIFFTDFSLWFIFLLSFFVPSIECWDRSNPTEDVHHLDKIPKKYLWNNIPWRPGIPELKGTSESFYRRRKWVLREEVVKWQRHFLFTTYPHAPPLTSQSLTIRWDHKTNSDW